MTYTVLIMAAGVGSRAGLAYNKVLHKIHGKMVLDYSVDFFENQSKCQQIIIICNEQDHAFLINYYKDRPISCVLGGDTRQDSVLNGLNQVKESYVLIHDAARPFLNKTVVNRLLSTLEKHGPCSIAIPSKNTLVQVDNGQFVSGLDRASIWQVQTPQAFPIDLIKTVHQKARLDKFVASDDTTLVAYYSTIQPKYILGDERSIKLTTPYDIKLLEVIL